MKHLFRVFAAFGVAIVLAVCPCCSAKASAEPVPSETLPVVATVTLTVEGMTCASCSLAVRTALKRLDGVRDASVSVEQKRAVVQYEPAKVTPKQMVNAVNDLGYHASLAVKGS